MKKLQRAVYFACLLWCVQGMGCANTGALRAESGEEIRKVLAVFAEGVARQDPAKVSRVLHRESLQYAWFKQKLMKIPQPVYLGMLKGKKIGGVDRVLKIHAMDQRGNLASVKATLAGKKLALDFYFHLMKLEGRWQIVSNLVRVVPRKS